MEHHSHRLLHLDRFLRRTDRGPNACERTRNRIVCRNRGRSHSLLRFEIEVKNGSESFEDSDRTRYYRRPQMVPDPLQNPCRINLRPLAGYEISCSIKVLETKGKAKCSSDNAVSVWAGSFVSISRKAGDLESLCMEIASGMEAFRSQSMRSKNTNTAHFPAPREIGACAEVTR